MLGDCGLRWATQCLEAGVPVHTVSARLGHVDLRPTARFAAPRPERIDDIADVLDRPPPGSSLCRWSGVVVQELK